MKPIKTSNNKLSNCTPISSECVIWEGPDLDCIELCHGDSISDIQSKIATLLCDILENKLTIDTDLLGCLPVNQVNVKTSLSDAVKVLSEQYCLLKERVTDLENATPTDGGIVDLRYTGSVEFLNCVQDVVGESLNTNATINEVIGVILKALCKTYTEYGDKIENLFLRVGNLELRGTGSGTSSIPNVLSSCLWSTSEGSKTIVEAWSILDSDWCDYRRLIGTTTTDPITQGDSCHSNINSYLLNTGDPTDWVVSDGTLFTSNKNAWKVLCALVDKVQTMDALLNSCCGFSCKKFEIGVNAINFDSGTNEIDLRFTFDGSISLNTAVYDYEDLGSQVVFTDIDGVSLTFSIDVTDDSTYKGLDLTGLNLSSEIQIDVDLQIKVTDPNDVVFECAKCLHTSFRSNIECAFCILLVTVSGDNPIVEINYTVNGNQNKLTITKEGSNMEYIIPALATIDSILNVNNSAVTVVSSTCPKLVIPEIDALACYSFIIDNDFYDSISDGYYYTITGYMVDGVDVVTYPIPVRADLTSVRSATSSLTNNTSEPTPGECGFIESSDTELQNSYTKLMDIPTNSYVFTIQKLCMFYESGSHDLFYTNVIVKAVSGKNIFIKLIAENTNQTTAQLNQKPETYIKGVEIAAGNDCDCCYVYDGS